MWLSVALVDDNGTETEIGKRVFGTEFKDAKGKHPVEIQDAVGVAKDDRLQPMEPVTQTYTLALPAGVEAANVRARLLYKSVPDELAKRAGVENPTTTMAEATKRVFATGQAKAADAEARSRRTRAGRRRRLADRSPLGAACWCCGAMLALVVGFASLCSFAPAGRASRRGRQTPLPGATLRRSACRSVDARATGSQLALAWYHIATVAAAGRRPSRPGGSRMARCKVRGASCGRLVVVLLRCRGGARVGRIGAGQARGQLSRRSSRAATSCRCHGRS